MQELHVVADELDRGINLVGNTGGQPAHCLELLGLAEINLKPVALRHVLGDGQTGLATIVVKTMEVDLHVDDAPVLADVLPLSRAPFGGTGLRSEERRVGKERRSRLAPQ